MSEVNESLLKPKESKDKKGKFGNSEYQPLDVDESNEWPSCRPRYIIIISLIILLCVCLLVAYFLGAFTKTATSAQLVPPNPIKELPPSVSHLRTFNKAAVCADGPPCAKIGKEILERNGSAVDAVVAAGICNGVVTMQSMGLGGGFLMTIYIKETKRAYSLNAREAAPLKATPDMFKADPEKGKKGPLAFGVPGELKGYWVAHRRFGKLPWKDVIEPTIKLCESGYNMSVPQFEGLSSIDKNDPNLKEWFLDENGNFKKAGSLIRPLKLCETLKVIAEKGGDDLYHGSLATSLAQDIKDMGGIVTKKDLENYEAKWEVPVYASFNGENLYTAPLPGSGPLLAFILNILKGYDFTKDSIDGVSNTILTYHRIVEAFKHAYAKRTELGDTAFINITDLLKNLTSPLFAEEVRKSINDKGTSQNPADYGATVSNKPDHGTAHLSVLAANGDAVSVTSTINLYFGAGITSKSTGIILNSGMDDFSTPGVLNYFGIPASPNNAIVPGKRSLSSIVPSVITDRNGDVTMVIGAAGGTRITSAVALVIMRYLWFGQNIKEAVDAPRLHHQIFPMEISYEYGNLEQVIAGLEALGHKTSRYKDRGSVICALTKKNSTIFANADFRKGGDVYGVN